MGLDGANKAITWSIRSLDSGETIDPQSLAENVQIYQNTLRFDSILPGLTEAYSASFSFSDGKVNVESPIFILNFAGTGGKYRFFPLRSG